MVTLLTDPPKEESVLSIRLDNSLRGVQELRRDLRSVLAECRADGDERTYETVAAMMPCLAGVERRLSEIISRTR